MPIHQTKLRMATPHATGTLTPHKPIPTTTRFVIVSSINWKRMNETAKPKNQYHDGFRLKRIELILSVTDANVSSGSITGAVECIGPSVYGLVSGLVSSATVLTNFRVRVFQLRLVSRAWSRVEIIEQRVISFVGFHSRHAAVRIVDVAENDHVRRTGGLACGSDLAVAHFSVLELCLDLRVLNALHAVRAFLHHAAAAHRHLRVAHQLVSRRVPVLI